MHRACIRAPVSEVNTKKFPKISCLKRGFKHPDKLGVCLLNAAILQSALHLTEDQYNLAKMAYTAPDGTIPLPKRVIARSTLERIQEYIDDLQRSWSI